MSGKSKSRRGEKTSVVLRVPRAPEATFDPILCSFPGGLPAALATEAVSPEDASLPRFVIKKHHGNKKLIVGKDHACLYSSIASTDRPRPLQTIVGIYDRHRGELVIQPTADQGYVYAMAQSVPRYQTATTSMNPAERRQALFRDFGSAKKRKVMKSQEANRVNVESVVGAGQVPRILAAMSESNQRAVADPTDDPQAAVRQATADWRRSFLPAHDPGAREAAQIYRAPLMAGPAVWTRLVHRVSQCLEKEHVLAAILKGPHHDESESDVHLPSDDGWFPSAVRIIKLLVIRKGATLKEQLAAALLLQDFLKLHVTLQRRRFIPGLDSGRPLFFGVPRDVGQRWLDLFATPVADGNGQMGYVMSKANKDSCCVHLFLLTLLAEGRFKSDDILPLASDLEMDVKDATHLLRLAGCTVKKAGGAVAAVLKVPLTFPPSIKRGPRRGR